jgi:hypothetical protein
LNRADGRDRNFGGSQQELADISQLLCRSPVTDRRTQI